MVAGSQGSDMYTDAKSWSIISYMIDRYIIVYFTLIKALCYSLHRRPSVILTSNYIGRVEAWVVSMFYKRSNDE